MRCPGGVLLTRGRSCLPADCLRGASVLRLHRHTSSPSQRPPAPAGPPPTRPDPSIECDGHLSQIDHPRDCRRLRYQRRMRIWTVVRSPEPRATTSVFVSFTEYDDSISIQSALGNMRAAVTSDMPAWAGCPDVSDVLTSRLVSSRHVTSRHVSSDVMTLQSRHDAPPVTETPLRFSSGSRRGGCS